MTVSPILDPQMCTNAGIGRLVTLAWYDELQYIAANEGLTHQNTFDKNSNSVLKFWIIIIITMLILIILGIIIITIAVKYGQKIHDKFTTLLGTVKKEGIEP